MKLAIIGTAGRGSDAARLTAAHWRMMKCIGQTVACTLGIDHLVSGGSAWADHCAVQLYLDGHAKHLTLHLPCVWVANRGPFDNSTTGTRLNNLHTCFRSVTVVDPFKQMAEAIKRGAQIHVNSAGFKARNTDVANDADVLLAFTFGPIGGEGGTADTVSKFCARRESRGDRWIVDSLDGDWHRVAYGSAYHYNLTDRVLSPL